MDAAAIQTLIAKLAVMQLQPGVDFDEVKARWKALAPKLHPDKNPGDPYATANFQKLQDAYLYICTYQQYLPNLLIYAPPPPPPPRPPTPPPPPIIKTINPNTPQPPPIVSSVPQPRTLYALILAAVLIMTACLTALFFLFAATQKERHEELEARLNQLRQDSLDALARKETPPKESPVSEPLPPRLPLFEPVMTDQFPAEELAQWTGGNTSELRSALYRFTDINLDGNAEMILTQARSSCRKEGCPVFLFWRKRGVNTDEKASVRDLLPNNYGWTSIAVTNHKTHGVRDLLFTAPEEGAPGEQYIPPSSNSRPLEPMQYRGSPFSEPEWAPSQRALTDSTLRESEPPARRPCKRLVWDDRSEKYIIDSEEPTSEECFEAEKHAWNIASETRRR